MRIAPIGLALWRDPGEARRVAREQSRVTHPVLGCLEACEVYTLLICGVLSGMLFSFFFWFDFVFFAFYPLVLVWGFHVCLRFSL